MPVRPEAVQTEFYFAFPDGAYHYDCPSCDALCCRGHGIGTAAPETPGLVSRYPELAWAATKMGPAGSDFTNPAGGCFFLTADNLCRVERDHGREAKPGVCVAFPFNDFSRIGDIVVVRPHFLCPLRLEAGMGTGHHAELLETLRKTGVDSRAMAQPGHDLSPERAQSIVRREEVFRDKCGKALGRKTFDEVLESENGELSAWRERALRIWGFTLEPASRDYLDDLLLALAAPLRVRLLLLSEDTRLRILYLAGAYLRKVARITDRQLTLQGAHHQIVSVLGVLRLFAYGDAPLRLATQEAIEGVAFQNPAHTLAFFQVLEELQEGRKLFTVLEGLPSASWSDLDRTIFFHQLARRIRELRRKRRARA